MNTFIRILAVLAFGVVLGAVLITAFPPANLIGRGDSPNPGPRPGDDVASRNATLPGSTPKGVRDSDAVTQVYERVSGAVVNITFTAQSRDVFGRASRQEGTGSGFIVDDQGHVVTNQHVVAGATRLDITLADGSRYIGEVVAADSANDLAVVKIQAPAEKLRQLTTVELGDSSALAVGQTVIAIGNPFGLERSASLGIVSSLGRTRPGLEQRLISNMIQTDAAINPGNSGGPLLNLRGEVIGINEQIETSNRSSAGSAGSIGIGFAIPVNTLKRYLPELKAGREPQHAWMGISGAPLTPTLAEQLRLNVTQGVILAAATPGGPAARAGLRGAGRGDISTADIITELDGRGMHNVEDIATYVDQRNPGDNVRVTFLRGGQTQNVDVALGTWENRDASAR